jgi:hypothetical protein
MPILPFRVKQSTNTTGTGTLVLNAAETNARFFSSAFGVSPSRVMYCIQWAVGFEIGYGDFDGGTPGSLTRSTIIASSNGNSIVTLPGGTKDVFAVFNPGARNVISIAGSLTLTLADLGNVIVVSGSVPSTLTLPAISSVPVGAGWMVRNSGTGVLTIDPNGAETINGVATLSLQGGQAGFIFDGGVGWECVTAGLPSFGVGLALSAGSLSLSAPVRAWGRYSGGSLVASFGVSSLTDLAGFGNYRINFSPALPSSDYAIVIGSSEVGQSNGQANSHFSIVSQTESACEIRMGGASGDPAIVTFVVVG